MPTAQLVNLLVASHGAYAAQSLVAQAVRNPERASVDREVLHFPVWIHSIRHAFIPRVKQRGILRGVLIKRRSGVHGYDH